MNYTLIILGVILMVVIYVMYSVIQGQQSKIGTNIVTLSNGTVNPVVSFSTLAVPTSERYNLSFWVSIQSLSNATNTLFEITDNVANNNSILRVQITSDGTLQYTTANSNKTSETVHTINTNFPLQKWVYVVLSIDSNTEAKLMDMYIDGKLTRSEKFTVNPIIPDKTCSIKFGTITDPNAVIYIAKFERNPVAMDPATAWSKYMAGNGGNYFSSLFSNYGAAFSITKDNLEVNKMSLF